MSRLTADMLRRLRGDVVRYRHPINRRVIFTSGVRYVMENGGGWLVNDIAMLVGSPELAVAARNDERIMCMHLWNLNVDLPNGTAVLYAKAGGDDEPFFIRKIAFTDFPLEKLCIYATNDGQDWTLSLPREH